MQDDELSALDLAADQGHLETVYIHTYIHLYICLFSILKLAVQVNLLLQHGADPQHASGDLRGLSLLDR